MNNLLTVPNLAQLNTPGENAYIKFRLNQQTTAILSVEYAQEVLIIPVERITAMPNMPECVLGLLSWRNRVLWVIDLAQILALPVDTANQSYQMVVIAVGKSYLCLVIQEVQGLARFTSNAIQPTEGVVSPNIIPYLHGCVLENGELTMLLNADAIAHSPVLYDHQL